MNGATIRFCEAQLKDFDALINARALKEPEAVQLLQVPGIGSRPWTSAASRVGKPVEELLNNWCCGPIARD